MDSNKPPYHGMGHRDAAGRGRHGGPSYAVSRLLQNFCTAEIRVL